MNIDSLTKTIVPVNLKWWEDPYTFACIELKSILDVKRTYIENLNIKNIFPNAEIILRKSSVDYRSDFFAKIDNYMIVAYSERILYVMYDPEFKTEDSINQLIDKIEDFGELKIPVIDFDDSFESFEAENMK